MLFRSVSQSRYVQPVLVSLLAVKVLGEKLRARQLLGLLLGLSGVVMVLGPSLEARIPPAGVGAILVALMGSTTATLFQKKIGSDIPLIAGTAFQYVASGMVLLCIALATSETHIQWSGKFIFAFIWSANFL